MGKVIVTRTKRKEVNTCCVPFCFVLVITLLQVLLIGAVALAIFWVYHYRGGFGWHDQPELEFNNHPVLMIGGFVFLMGEALLIFRICRCCRRIYNKLWHTVLHLLAMPTIAIGIVSVFDFHHRIKQKGPIPDLYSIHSWMGLITLGLFGLQFIVGFFSFLVLLCCESKTVNYRSALQPIHVHFGLSTFLMAIGTCLTGLMEKVTFSPDYTGHINNQGSIGSGRNEYQNLPAEAFVVNTLAMVLVGAGLLMAIVIRYPRSDERSESISERL